MKPSADPQRRTKTRAFSFYPGDESLLDFIAQYLGTSHSEAVRSAVRAYATHLAYLDGSRGGEAHSTANRA